MIITKQTILSTAGVVYPLGDGTFNNGLLIKALPTNTGIIYVGNDGSNSISTSTGFPLEAGDLMAFDNIGRLGDVYVIGTVNGDKLAILDMEI